MSWEDRLGNTLYAHGRCVDVSETGIRLSLRSVYENIRPRDVVSLRMDEVEFVGSAIVRHSRRKNSATIVGLEFCGGLRWAETEPQPDRKLSEANARRGLRSDTREPVSLTLRLLSERDDGEEVYLQGSCLNIAENGLLLVTRQRIGLRQRVYFFINELDFRGSGTVRYCYRETLDYRIGIQFSGGLRLPPATLSTMMAKVRERSRDLVSCG